MILKEMTEDLQAGTLRLRVLLCTYSIFIIGFFFFPHYKLHNNLLYFIVLIPYILTIRQSNLGLIFRSQIFRLMLILTLYLLSTLLWGARSTFRDYVRVFTDFLTVVSFFTLTCELGYTYQRLITKALFRAGCWASVIAVPIFMYVSSYTLTFPPQRIGPWGALRGPNWIGEVYGMIFLILYFQFIRKKPLLKNIIHIFLSLVALSILVLAQSRGPLLAAFISLFIAALLARDAKLFSVLISIAAAVGYCLYNRVEFFYNLFVERATSFRLDLIRDSIPLIKERLLAGHGILFKFSLPIPGGMKIDDPHNLYFQTCVIGGLIGLGLLTAFILRSLYEGYVCFKKENNMIFLVLILYASICAFTDAAKIIDHPWPFYLYFWLPFALLSAYELKLIDKKHSVSAITDEQKN